MLVSCSLVLGVVGAVSTTTGLDSSLDASASRRGRIDSPRVERIDESSMWTVVPGSLEVDGRGLSDVDIMGLVVAVAPSAAFHVGERNRLGFVEVEVRGMDVEVLVERLRESSPRLRATAGVIGRWMSSGDPFYEYQWNLYNDGLDGGGVAGADIGAAVAWEIESGDANVSIAFLDGTVALEHEDLRDAFRANPLEIPGNGIDDDSNGFVDDVHGWNFGLDTNQVYLDDIAAIHGTAVSGIAVARRLNGVGIAGVAGGDDHDPGCTAIAVVIGVDGPISSVIDDAILYAIDRGAKVLSMTFAVPETPAIVAAIEEAANRGIVMVAPSGNLLADVGFPARHPAVIAVGGSTRFDTAWSVSTGGPELDLVAPAVGIHTLDPHWDAAVWGGTSYAVPQVAATAALLLSWGTCLERDDVTRILRESATDLEAPGWDERSGWGRLDAGAALEQLLDEAPPSCRCRADLDGNGIVDSADLGMLLAAWGSDDVLADLSGDGVVGPMDISSWSFHLGACD